MSALMTVPFHGVNLSLVEHDGQPYVPMKSIVNGIGLDWATQQAKLKNNEARWGYRLIPIPSQGGEQDAGCLPLRKLPGWMQSVSVAKVSALVRDRLIEYQNECDDALWQYWNDGHAVNPRSQLPAANDSAVEFGKLALTHLPNLGDTSKQALLSHISELAFGQRLIPLPRVEESLKLAGEVGALFGVSAQKIGRLANQHGLKTDQYGELRLDKSKYSDRQCETFFYNSAAVDRFREILSGG